MTSPSLSGSSSGCAGAYANSAATCGQSQPAYTASPAPPAGGARASPQRRASVSLAHDISCGHTTPSLLPSRSRKTSAADTLHRHYIRLAREDISCGHTTLLLHPSRSRKASNVTHHTVTTTVSLTHDFSCGHTTLSRNPSRSRTPTSFHIHTSHSYTISCRHYIVFTLPHLSLACFHHGALQHTVTHGCQQDVVLAVLETQ